MKITTTMLAAACLCVALVSSVPLRTSGFQSQVSDILYVTRLKVFLRAGIELALILGSKQWGCASKLEKENFCWRKNHPEIDRTFARLFVSLAFLHNPKKKKKESDIIRAEFQVNLAVYSAADAPLSLSPDNTFFARSGKLGPVIVTSRIIIDGKVSRVVFSVDLTLPEKKRPKVVHVVTLTPF